MTDDQFAQMTHVIAEHLGAEFAYQYSRALAKRCDVLYLREMLTYREEMLKTHDN